MSRHHHDVRVLPQIGSAAALAILLALTASISMEGPAGNGSARPQKRTLGFATAIELLALDSASCIGIGSERSNEATLAGLDALFPAKAPSSMRPYAWQESGAAAHQRWVRLHTDLPPPAPRA